MMAEYHLRNFFTYSKTSDRVKGKWNLRYFQFKPSYFLIESNVLYISFFLLYMYMCKFLKSYEPNNWDSPVRNPSSSMRSEMLMMPSQTTMALFATIDPQGTG